MKLRIFKETDAGPNSLPVATVTIGTSPGGDLRPAHVEPSARFFLEAIDTTDADVRERLETALTRETVPVSRALLSTRGGVRTRGDTTMREPHGTPAFWRAALGRLPFEASLSCDPDDYKNLLAWVDPPLAAVTVAAPGVDVPPKRSFEISPTLRTQLIALIKAVFSPSPLPAMVRTHGSVRKRGGSNPDQQLLELLRRELETDPEFLLAVANLRLALSLPDQDCEKILAALDSLATRAKAHEAQSE